MPGMACGWRQPNISSLSRGRGKLGADPVRMLFEHVAGPVAAAGAPGVSCCGLRVVSMDGSVTDVPDSEKNAAFFGRPSNAVPGRGVPAGPVGRGGRVRDRQPAGRGDRPLRCRRAAASACSSTALLALRPDSTSVNSAAISQLPCGSGQPSKRTSDSS